MQQQWCMYVHIQKPCFKTGGARSKTGVHARNKRDGIHKLVTCNNKDGYIQKAVSCFYASPHFNACHQTPCDCRTIHMDVLSFNTSAMRTPNHPHGFALLRLHEPRGRPTIDLMLICFLQPRYLFCHARAYLLYIAYT